MPKTTCSPRRRSAILRQAQARVQQEAAFRAFVAGITALIQEASMPYEDFEQGFLLALHDTAPGTRRIEDV